MNDNAITSSYTFPVESQFSIFRFSRKIFQLETKQPTKIEHYANEYAVFVALQLKCTYLLPPNIKCVVINRFFKFIDKMLYNILCH